MAIISIPTSIGGINLPGNLINGPLSALFGTSGSNITKYPRDLESSSRSHVVMFHVYEVKEVELSEVKEWGGNLISSTANDVKNLGNTLKNAWNTGGVAGLLNTGSSAVDSLTNEISNIFDFFEDDGISETGNKAYKKIQEFTTQERILKEHIALYMPETMQFTYSPEYDTGVTLASAAGALPAVGKVASVLSNILEGNDAARLALNKMGYVFNPQKQMLFKGIDFRNFQMSFTFTPYSRDEAEAVKKIIKIFRSYSAPTIVTQGAGMFFKPPGIFEIEFKFNGSINRHIPKLQRCVITNVDVNYAPNGWSTHNDGSPVQTTITLDLQEMVLIDKAAIERGY